MTNTLEMPLPDLFTTGITLAAIVEIAKQMVASNLAVSNLLALIELLDLAISFSKTLVRADPAGLHELISQVQALNHRQKEVGGYNLLQTALKDHLYIIQAVLTFLQNETRSKQTSLFASSTSKKRK